MVMCRIVITRACRATIATMLAVAAAPAGAQSSFARATSMTWDGALTGMFMGLLLFSVAYNVAFFALLRERFLIWQSMRALFYFLLVIGLSPLSMGPWLDPHSFARQVFLNIFFDLAVAMSGVFVRNYLETGMIGPRTYRALGWSLWIVMLTTPAVLIPHCPPLYMAARNIVMVSLLLLCSTTIARACWLGSRTARYQIAAWSGISLVFGISLFHDIVLGRPFDMFLFALFPALALETILTALGILDRLNRLRSERESARAEASALELIAYTDPLTGIANRRAIEARFAAHRPIALAIVDLDHFKTVNDRHGHDVGDCVIAQAGAALASGSAFAARIGGEEFALLLYGTVIQAAAEAEALRLEVGAMIAAHVPMIDHPVTASMGVALVGPSVSFGQAMKTADINLYAAKDRGRNRAVHPAPLAA